MAQSLNKVMLIGRIGNDPQVNPTPRGKNVCTIRVATSESWKDQSGQKQERTEWTSVVLWGSAADFVGKYLRKGSLVYVEGRLQTRSWDDASTGAKRFATEVICDKIDGLSGGKSEDSAPSGEPGSEPYGDEDLP